MSSNPAPPKNGAVTAAEPFVFGSPSGNSVRSSVARGFSDQTTAPADPQTEQKAYDRGIIEGEARARASFEKSLADLRNELSETLRQFTLQRESYFQKVEREVIQLALSIARKILHREVQIDPLVLTGVVRMALDTLNEGTQVRLRAHPDEIPLWREYFRASAGQRAPELIGDPSLASGCCLLETDLGNTQVSLDGQLKEIEQGFFDLLEQRPRLAE